MCPLYGIDESFVEELKKVEKFFVEKDAVHYQSLIQTLREEYGSLAINFKVKNFARS